MQTELSIIIPTYNERINIEKLIPRIFLILKEHNIHGEIIIVDDNSPDGTAKAVLLLKTTYRHLSLLERPRKMGLSSAVIAGFQVANGKIIGVMDADLSHPPEKIPEMFNTFKNDNVHLVIGSRYILGGKIEGWNMYRRMMSRGAIIISKIFTNTQDTMSGFFMIRKNRIPTHDLNPRGFKILLELLIKSKIRDVVEIPITFTNRTYGSSKAGLQEIFWYLQNIWGYLFLRRDTQTSFLKFFAVSSIGVIVNVTILFFFVEFLKLFYIYSAIIAFVMTVAFSFLLKKVLVFDKKLDKNFSEKVFIFLRKNLIELVINLGILYFLVEIFHAWYIIAQLIGMFVINIVNIREHKKPAHN
ncbi:MAG: glycosyltransferase family 2 protein [Patescibacteria group bacterium]